MDYVREELLRQQKLLATLMSGGAKTEENPEGEPEQTPGTEESLWEASSGTRAFAEGTGGTGPETAALRVRMSQPGQGERDPAADGDASSEREFPRETSAGGIGAAEPDRWSGIRTGMPDPDDWGWTSVVRRSAAGGTDAQAVSRAIQRDARRYDGGFTIY